MNIPTLELGALCSIVKGETGIMSATAGQYPLVVTAQGRKTCNSYQFDTQAVCIPLVSSSGHGKKSLNHVHYQEGKFALGSILAAVIPKDPKQLSASYLQRYLQFYKDRKLVVLMKGAANVSLAIRDIAKVKIPVPHIDKQYDFVNLFNKLERCSQDLHAKFDEQAAILKQLRQAILQEAIEGKLTVQWRAENPVVKGDPNTDAQALLTQIHAEKQSLIAQGKRKKDKPLAPIDTVSVHKLPESWRISTLGFVSQFIDYRGMTPTKIESGIRLITAKNVKFGFLQLSPEEFISKAEFENRMTRGYPKKGDVFFTTEAPLGNVCLNSLDETLSVGQRIITMSPIVIKPEFLLYFLMSQFAQTQIDIRKTGVTAKGIKSAKLINVPIFIPAMAEQSAIVAKVQHLLAQVDALETELKIRQQHAEQLMQSVLREAFHPNS